MPQILNVVAAFDGKNGSMGFETGKEYTLRMNLYADGAIMIVSVNGSALVCPYSGLKTFFENWTNIKPIK
ncbi:MAG: hypothetical protein ACK4EY_15220 [Flavipsychrobacter sp.]